MSPFLTHGILPFKLEHYSSVYLVFCSQIVESLWNARSDWFPIEIQCEGITNHSYVRLEFLGNAVIDYLVTAYIFATHLWMHIRSHNSLPLHRSRAVNSLLTVSDLEGKDLLVLWLSHCCRLLAFFSYHWVSETDQVTFANLRLVTMEIWEESE